MRSLVANGVNNSPLSLSTAIQAFVLRMPMLPLTSGPTFWPTSLMSDKAEWTMPTWLRCFFGHEWAWLVLETKRRRVRVSVCNRCETLKGGWRGDINMDAS
jgi:hypothetical protein